MSGLQWVLDGYTLVFAGMLLSAGSLGDRLGGRRVFQAGLLLFTLASAACAAAPSVPLLVVARLAQGLGAALLVPSSLALLRAAYHDPRERARAVGAWGAVAGIAAAFGPVIGGLVVAASSWRAVFVLNLPVGIAGLLLGRRHLPPAGERTGGGIDLGGQLIGIAALSVLTLGLIDGGRAGWTSPETLVPLALSLPLWVAFVACERRERMQERRLERGMV